MRKPISSIDEMFSAKSFAAFIFFIIGLIVLVHASAEVNTTSTNGK